VRLNRLGGRLTCRRLNDLEGQHVGIGRVLLPHARSMPDRLSIGKRPKIQTDPLPLPDIH